MLISLLKFLIEPFNIFWLLLIAIVLMWHCQKTKWLKWLMIACGFWFLLVTTPLLPNSLILSLENQYSPLNVSELGDTNLNYHIIILGAGHNFDSAMPPNTLLSQSALRRLSEGIRIHRKLPNSKLVLSGYSDVGGITGAKMLKKTALVLGVNETAILLQEKPINTFQEAKYYAEKYSNEIPTILVTAAAHMPRAMKTFQQFGITPIASPTDYLLTGSRKSVWIGLPDVENMKKIRIALYEYAGSFFYKVALYN